VPRGVAPEPRWQQAPTAVDLEEEDEGYPDVGELSDEQLEAELTVAASTPDHRRIERYQALLAERERRSAAP
jgi:hypothetical protein